METHLSYLTGTRNIKNPFISPSQLSQDGFYIWNDKNINNGYTTRTGYLPPALVEDVFRFEEVIQFLMGKVKKSKSFLKGSLDKLTPLKAWNSAQINTTRPVYSNGFFLLKFSTNSKTISACDYTRHQAEKITKPLLDEQNNNFFKMAKNSNRHFFRSTLIERGLNPEYVDELMGHRHIGTESWNQRGMFNPLDFKKNVIKTVNNIYSEFNVKSPLKKINLK